MSASTKSAFPLFPEGDVVIFITTGRVYQLHSSTLRRHSPFFEQNLLEERAAVLSPKAKKEGVSARYRLDLTKTSEDGCGTLLMKHVDTNGRTPSSYSLPEIENGKIPNKYFGAYDNLFRAFYSEKLDLDDTNIATVLSGAMAVIEVAGSVGSVDMIRESVDIALLRQGQVLYRSICTNAIAWVDLGRRIQSPTIFKEALIHLIGQWNAIDPVERRQMDPGTRALCESKVADLNITKQGMEMRMLGHYPGFLRRNIAETGHVGRTTYANDIYMWMTVALFRQWFAQNIAENRNLTGADGGAYMYRQISKGGTAYLDHTKLATFHQYFPMSAKAKNVLENHMNSLKAELQTFPGELLKNRSQYDDSRDPMPYLTCAIIDKKDFPWTPQIPGPPATAPRNAGQKRHQEDIDTEDDEDFGYLGSSAMQT